MRVHSPPRPPPSRVYPRPTIPPMENLPIPAGPRNRSHHLVGRTCTTPGNNAWMFSLWCCDKQSIRYLGAEGEAIPQLYTGYLARENPAVASVQLFGDVLIWKQTEVNGQSRVPRSPRKKGKTEQLTLPFLLALSPMLSQPQKTPWRSRGPGLKACCTLL